MTALTRPRIEDIARAALPHALALCERWLPGGRRVRDHWECGSIEGGPGRSMRVNLLTGQWIDLAVPEHRGGDLVALAARVHRLSQREAADKIAAMLGLGGTHHGR